MIELRKSLIVIPEAAIGNPLSLRQRDLIPASAGMITVEKLTNANNVGSTALYVFAARATVAIRRSS
jgi:hypothetical protein